MAELEFDTAALEWMNQMAGNLKKQKVIHEIADSLRQGEAVTRVAAWDISTATLDKYRVPYSIDEHDDAVINIQRLLSVEEGYFLQLHTRHCKSLPAGQSDNGKEVQLLPPLPPETAAAAEAGRARRITVLVPSARQSVYIHAMERTGASGQTIIDLDFPDTRGPNPEAKTTFGFVSLFTEVTSPWHVQNPPVYDTDDAGRLCYVCSRINFDYLVLRHDLGKTLSTGVDSILLGSLRDVIHRTNCAFCRLVTQTCGAADGRVELFDPDDNDIMVILGLEGRLKFGVVSEKPNLLVVEFTHQMRNKDGDTKNVLASFELCLVTVGFSNNSLLRAEGGRRVSRKKINFDLIRRWLYLISDSSSDSDSETQVPESYESRKSRPANLRLIDVDDMCIVPAPPNAPYYALSYVWGNCNQVCYDTRSAKNMHRRGGLPIEQLPKTISDAMQIVRKLGERYLWVDVLCILQDDVDDMKAQIASMDQVYGSASLTIAAIDIASANDPLPGVRSWTRKPNQHTESVQSLELANVLPGLTQTVKSSKWGSRSWTYQERVLSSRVLHICDTRVFLESAFGVLDESLGWLEKAYVGNRSAEDNLQFEGVAAWATYARAVEAYSTRNLSFQSDALNAFAGIQARLRPIFRGDFVSGIPVTELEAGLLWEPYGNIHRRIDRNSQVPLFPSWSWAGWKGHIKHYPQDEVAVVKWVTANGDEVTSDDLRESNEVFKAQWTHHAGPFLASRMVRSWYTHSDAPTQPFRHPTSLETEARPKLLTNEVNTELKFWTWSAPLFVREWDDDPNMLYRINTYPIVVNQHEGQQCQAGLLTTHSTLDPDELFQRYEFVVISRTKRLSGATGSQEPSTNSEDPLSMDPKVLKNISFTIPTVSFKTEENDSERSHFDFSPERFDATKAWPLYNCLMVKPKSGMEEAGLFERIGVATVHVDAVHQAGAVWKMVSLA